MSLPADLYLHRDDVEKILAMSTPKRAAGPGRKVKYGYIEAAFDLRADPRLNTLEWFQSAANVSADVPDRKLLTPYARNIFNQLKNNPSREGR